MALVIEEALAVRRALLGGDSNRFGVVLDVRGTIIDPILDSPVDQSIARCVARLLQTGLAVAINTATSITSLRDLLILPLLQQFRMVQLKPHGRLILYVDSGTIAYVIDDEYRIRRVDDYGCLVFDEGDVCVIHDVMDQTNGNFGFDNPLFKVKAGQINYYCGGSWERRSHVAEYMRQLLHSHGASHIRVMVPTAKETIDIALCEKSRGVEDMRMRFSLAEGGVVVIGDSLQVGGADLAMYQVAQGNAWQVGPEPPRSGVRHIREMPATVASAAVLSELLAVITDGTMSRGAEFGVPPSVPRQTRRNDP